MKKLIAINLYTQFLTARRNAEASSLFAHYAGRYPLSGVGDVNTYALFSETFVHLLNNFGLSGFIVPSGLATESTTKNLFGFLVKNHLLISFFEFENYGFFPGAGQRHMLKFALTTICGSSCSVASAEFLFQGRSTLDLNLVERKLRLDEKDMELFNPNTLTCPVFRTKKDYELTKKIYKSSVVIAEDRETSNSSWNISLVTMFHMSNDSIFFKEHKNVGYLPLYESKMFHIFDHRWSTFEVNNGDYREAEHDEKRNVNFVVKSKYWVDEHLVNTRLPIINWMISFRCINNSANARAFVASVLPRCALGNSAGIFISERSASNMAIFYGAITSLIFEFVVRQKLSGTNLNFFIVKQLPVIKSDLIRSEDLAFVVPRILELTHTARDMQGWANDLLAALPSADPRPPEQHGTPLPPFPWNPERRAQLRAELDAYYARLYGLTRDELRYILDPAEVMGADYPSETFRVLKNSELRAFGEYRTQRLVLAAWDNLHSH